MKSDPGINKNLDKSIEKILGNLLRTGVITASVVVAFGAILFLIRHGFEIPDYQIFKSVPFYFSDLGNLFNGVIAFRPVSIIELGILLLIATPVLRVIFSVFAFVYERDYMYVVFTLIVLLVLIYSFFA